MSEMQTAGKNTKIDNEHHCNSNCNHVARENREKKHIYIFCRCSQVF